MVDDSAKGLQQAMTSPARTWLSATRLHGVDAGRIGARADDWAQYEGGVDDAELEPVLLGQLPGDPLCSHLHVQAHLSAREPQRASSLYPAPQAHYAQQPQLDVPQLSMAGRGSFQVPGRLQYHPSCC